MKAAVINNFGEIPQYADFPDPIAGPDEKLIYFRAGVLENFDKVTAAGTHYASKHLFPQFPAVVGHAAIGVTEDGALVGFSVPKPPYGAFAEKAIAQHVVPIPEDIDAAEAAAISPSALTSLLPLKYAARLSRGETVLINGATGVSGKMAIQVAKLLGAGNIVGTGRDENSLKAVEALGAVPVSLLQPDDQLAEAITAAGGENGYDVVIDFLWGHPAEVLISTFVPKVVGIPKKRIRYIQSGEKAGSHISLPASALRTSGLELTGLGPLSHEVLAEESAKIWQWIREGKLQTDIECVPLARIANAWQRNDLAGKRLVIVP